MTTEDDYTNMEIGDVTERSEKSGAATVSPSSSVESLSRVDSPAAPLEHLQIGVPEVGDVNLQMVLLG